MRATTTIGLGLCLGVGLLVGADQGLLDGQAVALAAPRAIESQPVTPAAVKQEAYGRCRVVGIRTGQLALRFNPNGASRAGLNNGNIVDVYDQQEQDGITWYYVHVIRGPNSRVTGLRGWVNSNYLDCAW